MPPTTAAATPQSIFLLAGQSNMAGRGGVIHNTWDGVVPVECRPNPAVLRLSGGLRWVEAEEPLGQDIDVNKTCGIGPGLRFANELLRLNPGIGVVGLVPCAVGGTSIRDWARGGFLYGLMVKRAWASVQSGGRMMGVLWYQGESDTTSREDADIYKERVEKFFEDMRTDLHSPTLPIIQVALASGMGPYTETVREAQLGLHLVNVRTIDAKRLPLEPDRLHLTTAAQVELGEMFARAFLLFGKSPTQPNSAHRFESPSVTTAHHRLHCIAACCSVMLLVYSLPFVWH
ncbi:putative carbohydrate esterase [Drosera capensis]